MNTQISNQTAEQTLTTPDIVLRSGYRYIQVIGEGANGKTYKAQNIKTGENVAIKALKFSENLKNYELFKREAEVLKSISVPHVPKYYDFISDNDEFTQCYLVQEFVPGESLLKYIEKHGVFTEAQTLTIMLNIANILKMLQTMYNPPVIHRDIKPSNILFNPPEDVYLIDFGAVANPQKRSLNSTVAGTVGYMAPEQLIGDCTIQSDFYALGATALHMLTGVAPADIESDSFVLQFEPVLKEKNPNISSNCIALLHSLLAPGLDERPKNADQLIRQITSVMCNSDLAAEAFFNRHPQVIEEQKKLYQLQDNMSQVLSKRTSSVFIMAVVTAVLICLAIWMILISGNNESWWIYFVSVGFILFGIACGWGAIIYKYKTIYNLSAYETLISDQKKRIESLRMKLRTQMSSNNDQEEDSESAKDIDAREKRQVALSEGDGDFISPYEKPCQGQILAVYADCMEYYFTVDGKSYLGLCRNRKNRPLTEIYKVGDSVNIRYDCDTPNVNYMVTK